MATNHTTNYNLNLWEANDKFVREEFNENTTKLDAAIAKCGNCRVQVSTYVGDGETSRTFTFDRAPVLIWFTGGLVSFWAVPGQTKVPLIRNFDTLSVFTNWEENAVTVQSTSTSSENVCNKDGTLYTMVTLTALV